MANKCQPWRDLQTLTEMIRYLEEDIGPAARDCKQQIQGLRQTLGPELRKAFDAYARENLK